MSFIGSNFDVCLAASFVFNVNIARVGFFRLQTLKKMVWGCILSVFFTFQDSNFNLVSPLHRHLFSCAKVLTLSPLCLKLLLDLSLCFRLKSFRASLYKLFQKERAQSVQLDQVTTHVNSEHASEPFNDDDIMNAISAMMDENQIMLSDRIVFLI